MFMKIIQLSRGESALTNVEFVSKLNVNNLERTELQLGCVSVNSVIYELCASAKA